MAWTAPRTWVVGEVLTAALLNTHLRDNLLETAVAKVTTAGDVVYATGANALTRLGASGNGGKFLRFNSGATAVEAAEVPTIISADAFQWGTKTANRYTANFASDLLLNNAVFGDLADVGWVIAGTPTAPQAAGTASTGDLDSDSDHGQQFILFGTSGDSFGSPKVVGAAAILDDLEFHVGTRPTKVTIRVRAAFTAGDAQDSSGVGIGTDANATLATGGAGSQFMLTVGATNFELWDGAAATDLGVAVDTSAHSFDIEITFAAATYRVLLDGVEVKAAAAITQDFWPMCVKSYRGGFGGNPQVFSYGVKYE